MEHGIPNSGDIFECMLIPRKFFKTSLKHCKLHEDEIRRNILLDKFRENTKLNFWKEVRRIKGVDNKKARNIDNLSSNSEVVQLFYNKFRAIHQSDENLDCSEANAGSGSTTDFAFDCESLYKCTASLRTGVGSDGIHLNHIKYASFKFFYYLKTLFNSIVIHAHVPADMLLGSIHPLIKDRHGNISDSNNYRPITTSTYFLKLFEYSIYPILKSSICLSSNQFGFRDNTSCQMAHLVLRETVQSYLDRGSSVYASFLDMSKAFDTVNHALLLEMVNKLEIPHSIKLLLKDIYSNQRVNVRYCGVNSEVWRLSRGVRQGSVLSSLLFSLYINGAIENILNSLVGCCFGSRPMQIIAYADDLVLLCPTRSGLQFLLNLLHSLLFNLGLNLNPNKSLCLKFNYKKSKLNDFTFFIDGAAIKNVDQAKYLGFSIQSNLTIAPDIDRVMKHFNKQFFGFYVNFKFAHFSTLAFLFRTFCFSLYGAELWYDRRGAMGALRSLATAFHGGIKRILKMGKRASSHYACNLLNMLTFDHLINKRQFKFFFTVFKNRSPCLRLILNPLRYSFFSRAINRVATNVYSINDLLNNDFQAVCARIEYVQCGEPIYGIDY